MTMINHTTPLMRGGLTVLSLCDGMSCGQIALKELGIDVKTYYS